MADSRTVLLASLLALAIVPAEAGCTSDPATARHPIKTAPSPSPQPVRTDREPIIKWFPLLGDFTEVHWQSGRIGNPRIPGPNDIFIHALVVLRPETRDAIVSRFHWQPARAFGWEPVQEGWKANVSPQLRSFLPANGTWVVSEEFAKELTSTIGYGGFAYFEVISGVVYFDAGSN